jgi:CHAT domain-containing protein/tetratricopeptide (TPR) repeat protein
MSKVKRVLGWVIPILVGVALAYWRVPERIMPVFGLNGWQAALAGPILLRVSLEVYIGWAVVSSIRGSRFASALVTFGVLLSAVWVLAIPTAAYGWLMWGQPGLLLQMLLYVVALAALWPRWSSLRRLILWTCHTLTKLARSYRDRGDLVTARALSDSAMRVALSTKEVPLALALSTNLQGSLFLDIGERRRALRYLYLSLDLQRDRPTVLLPETLCLIGQAEEASDPKAAAWARRTAASAALDSGHPPTLLYVLVHGGGEAEKVVLENPGIDALAVERLLEREVYRLYDPPWSDGPSREEEARWAGCAVALARRFRATGRRPAAVELLDRLLHWDPQRPPAEAQEVRDAELLLAVLRHEAGDTPAALNLFDRLMGRYVGFLRQVAGSGSPDELVAAGALAHAALGTYATVAAEYPGRSAAQTAQLFFRVAQLKGVAAEARLVFRAAVSSRTDDRLRQAWQKYATARRRAGHLGFRAALGEGGEIQKEINSAETDIAIAERNLVERLGAAALYNRLAELSGADLPAAVGTDRVLLDYYCAAASPDLPGRPARYVGFVLDPAADPAVRMADLGEAAPVEARVRDFLNVLTQRADRPEAGPQLAAAVLTPLLSDVPAGRGLLISTDGELALVPFTALPAGPDGVVVIDRADVTYLTSARELLEIGARPARVPGPPVVLAAPAYGRTGAAWAGIRFRPLPHALYEGEAVARALGVEVLTGEAATVAYVRQLRGPRVLHFATHGFFYAPTEAGTAQEAKAGAPPEAVPGADLAGDPMCLAGIALAGANAADCDDGGGLLLATDAAQLDLLGTEIVTLSACETGVGVPRVGEGLFGLRRGLSLAGTRAVACTLWSVEDLATALLMGEFYRLLGTQVSPALALRAAQQWLRGASAVDLDLAGHWERVYDASGRSDPVALQAWRHYRAVGDERSFADPYYWAPWTLYGAALRARS